MQFAESLGEAVLNEVVRGDEVARQRARITPEAGISASMSR
jgi:hypothetical protein